MSAIIQLDITPFLTHVFPVKYLWVELSTRLRLLQDNFETSIGGKLDTENYILAQSSPIPKRLSRV